MPLALILIAIGLILAGVRGSYQQLGTLLKGDFTGQNNFFTWLVAIGVVGCIGYVPRLEKWSRMFIALIVLAMFLRQDTGLFSKFVAALQSATAGSPNYSPGNPNAGQGGGAASGGVSGLGGSLIGKALGIPTPNQPGSAFTGGLPGVLGLQGNPGDTGQLGKSIIPDVANGGPLMGP